MWKRLRMVLPGMLIFVVLAVIAGMVLTGVVALVDVAIP